MKARKVFALSILTASMALAAGCSSDDDDDGDTETPVTMPDPDMPTTPDMPVTPVEDTTTNTGGSILDVARGTDGDDEDTDIDAEGDNAPNADLTSLVGAIASVPNAQSILNLLDDETQTLTVFAPNNDAFDALGDNAPSGEALEGVLNYHVIAGTNLDGTAISALTPGEPATFTTAAGSDLSVTLDDTGAVSVTDGQGNVVPVAATVEAPTNGTVHVIGSVLLPPDAPEEPTEPTEPTDPDAPVTGGGDAVAGSTFAIIEDDDDLSEFEALVRSSNFKEALEDVANRSQVVFAPRNGSLEEGIDTVVSYVFTNRSEVGPVAPGTYAGTGATALSFEVAGEGETLTVNGQPAQYIETESGAALYVFGGESEEED